MTVENKINEVRELIDKIQEHSGALGVKDRLSALELSALISKITKLHETALILKYLVKREQGVSIVSCEDELQKNLSQNLEEEHVLIAEEEPVLVEDIAVAEEEAIEEVIEEVEKEVLPQEKIEEPENLEHIAPLESTLDELVNKVEEKIEDSVTETETAIEEELIEESEPQTDFFDEVLKKEESSISLNDIETKEEFSSSPDINERFSDVNDASVGGHLQKQPISDLISAIGINERYLYSSELFNGEMTDFKRSIQLLNDFETGEEAKEFFNNELRSSYGWSEDNELALALYNLVERRYL